jgi:hypothetical protein
VEGTEVGLKIEDEKVRRLEEQRAEIPGDDWMDRMIPAGWDGKGKTEVGGQEGQETDIRTCCSHCVVPWKRKMATGWF